MRRPKPFGAAEQIRRHGVPAATVEAAGDLRKQAQPVLARLKARTLTLRSNQSQITQWMHVNYDQFAGIVGTGVPPGWKAIADELTAAGLITKSGQSLTASYVRLAWFKVKRARERKRAERTPAPSPTQCAHTQPPDWAAQPFRQPSVLADWKQGDVSRESNNASGTEPALDSLRAFARSIGANPIQVLRRIRDTPGVAELVRVDGRPRWRITNPEALVEAMRTRADNGNRARQPNPAWPPEEEDEVVPTNPWGEEL